MTQKDWVRLFHHKTSRGGLVRLSIILEIIGILQIKGLRGMKDEEFLSDAGNLLCKLLMGSRTH